MPKRLLLITIVALALFAFGGAAEALDLTNRLNTVGTAAQFEDATRSTLAETVGRIIRVFLSILGMVFIAYVVYAGQLWMTARGNEEQIEKAKRIIRGSIIGILITVSAYAITGFVINAIVSINVINTTSTPPPTP